MRKRVREPKEGKWAIEKQGISKGTLSTWNGRKREREMKSIPTKDNIQ